MARNKLTIENKPETLTIENKPETLTNGVCVYCDGTFVSCLTVREFCIAKHIVHNKKSLFRYLYELCELGEIKGKSILEDMTNYRDLIKKDYLSYDQYSNTPRRIEPGVAVTNRFDGTFGVPMAVVYFLDRVVSTCDLYPDGEMEFIFETEI